MLDSVDLRANIAVMKILVNLLIQDYLHIPCKKQLMKHTGWWLLQGCLGQFLKIYLITFPYNCCHHLNGVSNNWELSEIYIFLSAPYWWCNRWPV